MDTDDTLKNNTESDGDEEFQDDISIEEDSDITDGDPAALTAKLKKVRTELRRVQKERQEFLAGWQRAKADYINLKKEEDARRSEINKYAKADVLNDLIRLADSFTLAFADKTAWEKVPENWRKGVEYIHNQLLIVFRDHGLEELRPEGEMFDPSRDESISTIETDQKNDDGRILEVVKNGYRLNGKIIRPAQVRIGKYEK